MGILRNLLSAAAAYVPTEWATGDVITAEKLNHMENGIADSGDSIVLHYDSEAGHFDKTFNEVRQAMSKGVIPTIDASGELELLVKYNDSNFIISGGDLEGTTNVILKASSGDDYLNFYEYPPD